MADWGFQRNRKQTPAMAQPTKTPTQATPDWLGRPQDSYLGQPAGYHLGQITPSYD
jgi:hypothetical protein